MKRLVKPLSIILMLTFSTACMYSCTVTEDPEDLRVLIEDVEAKPDEGSDDGTGTTDGPPPGVGEG